MGHLSLADKREFLKSMQIERQALLKNQVSQGTISGRGRSKLESAGRIVRWTLVGLRTWKPDESRTSGRRAEARLIVKGCTDPDLPNIESHSPALTREGFYDTLTVCVQPWTQVTTRGCAAGVQYWRPDQERTTTLRPNAARWNSR